MSRRKRAPKRRILPDPLFKSELLSKFINTVMKDGKKSVAEKIVYGALNNMVSGDEQANIYNNDGLRQKALSAFKDALEAMKPMVEVKSRRVGGSTYQVPMEVRPDRQVALAMRWAVEYASQRHEKSMKDRLAGELKDALEGRGGAMKKREDVHRMAKANQAFAHFRW